MATSTGTTDTIVPATSTASVSSSSEVTLDSYYLVPEISHEAIKEELSSYVSLAADVSEDFDAIVWWMLHARELPNWSAAVKKILPLQP